ncbi:ABC transporter substrate-binding protein [Tenggerimyces flavus]|uniref:ABC transporter substrate-binding protein n=1 Tax=Tenggerimyces flavus TaxID=1708749 RepID=A0ABV7YKP5_9ACTN|nr:extracellular solute-binding protein [Tenggerimyces flavus]MBM7789610.1 ABC-type glycerol-3-phosphate transport system substrate-binding protein [Tenggerimyces flavus]
MSTFNPTLSRRQMLIAGAATSAAAFLASCGNSPESGTAKKPSTLGLSDWWGGQFDNYFPTMEKETGIKIAHQVYSYAPEKIFTQLASGTAPDLFLIDAYWNGNLFPHEQLYVPFDERLKERKIDMSKWNVDQAKESGFEGKISSLSLYTAQDFIVMVNKGMAEESGIAEDMPVWGSPTFDTWKWDTFVDWLKAGTKVGRNGVVEQYGLGSVPTNASFFVTLLYDLGGTLYDDDWNYGESKSMLDSEPAIGAAQQIADLFVKHKVAVPTGTETSVRGGTYLAKRCVATLQLSTPSAYPEENNFPMSYFHLPYANRKVHCFGGGSLCVNAQSKFQEAALDWAITFTTNTEVRTKFLQFSSVPSYDPLPIVDASPEGTPKTIALINLSRIKGMSPLPANAENVTVYPRWFGRYASTATQNAIESALDQIILGKATAKDALTEAKQRVDKEIDDGRRAAGE